MPGATDSRVLGQIMLLQGTLDSMPTDESMSHFVVRGLKSVPGIKSLNVCIRGAVAEKNDLCASCNYQWGETEDNFGYLCKLEDHGNTKRFPIRTVDRLYGFVIISLNDPPDAFTPYEPYLQNIVTVIALSIDNRQQKQVLEAFNKQLQEEVEHRKQAEEALKDSEQRYRELSIVDALTQLYNSRHFYFQLKIELDRSNRYGQPLTLLLLDLDNFKAFNDAYGHVEGDQALSRLGQVVKRCLRQTDSAYRYGGEEFTVLLPMTTSADAAVTAERIKTEFKKEGFSPAPGKDVHVTVSIGLGQYKQKEDMKAFVHRVDQLMYQAKKNGKDRVCSET